MPLAFLKVFIYDGRVRTIRGKLASVWRYFWGVWGTRAQQLRAPENFFLAAFVFFGLALLIIIPPMQVADESSHFLRAYQITRGQLVSQPTDSGVGGKLPEGVVAFTETANRFALSFHAERRFHPRVQFPELWRLSSSSPERSVRFVNTALYAPMNYAVPAIGITAAKLFTSKVLIQFYVARLCNFVFFAACIFIAIRLIPRGKWILAAIALLPMALFEAVSLSADVYIIGITALFIAYWWRLYGVARFSGRQYIQLGLLALLITQSKQSYLVFIPSLLLLALPARGNKPELKRRLLFGLTVGATAAVLAVGWMWLTKAFTSDFAYWAGLNGVPGDPSQRIANMLAHPLEFGGIILNTLLTNNGNGIVWSFFGIFGWLDTTLPIWLMVALGIIMFLVYGISEPVTRITNRRFNLPRTVGVSFAGLAVLFIILLAIVLYAYWTPTGSLFVGGMQGRYFVPVLIFLTPVLYGHYSHTIAKKFVLGSLLAVLVCSTTVILYRYYLAPGLVDRPPAALIQANSGPEEAQ